MTRKTMTIKMPATTGTVSGVLPPKEISWTITGAHPEDSRLNEARQDAARFQQEVTCVICEN